VDLRGELSADAPALARVRQPLPAPVIEFVPGNVDLGLTDLSGDCLGLLLLDGLLLAELRAGRAQTAWLVGGGDLINPSGLHEVSLTERTRWRVLTPARVAVLDREFRLRAGGIPVVSHALLSRATRTTSWLLGKSLILSSPLIEERLLLMFGLYGERWGTMTRDGVVLSLPLTHAMLAALVGARRPSVTLALHSLERHGLLDRTYRGTWLLRRGGGNDGAGRASCAAEYERALGLSWAVPAAPA
jgi:CRP-like cAMP-binding protein